MTSTIDALLQEAVDRREVAGVAAIAVRADGPRYLDAFGLHRSAEGMPTRTDSMYRLASVTKGFTAVAAMQQLERGALDLDAPAADVVPEITESRVIEEDGSLRPPRRPITLRHLLSHTSGFPYWFSSARFGALRKELGLPAYVDGKVNLEVPMLFDPGEGWVYGTGIDWTGRMIERVTGSSLTNYLDTNLFAPLGMRDTTLGALRGDQVARLGTPHLRQPDGSLEEGPLDTSDGNGQGGGGALSTPADYARFLRFMLSDGTWDGARLLAEDSFARMATDQIGDLVAGKYQTGHPPTSYDADFSEGGTAGHGLGLMLTRAPTSTGRAAGTMSWAGAYNLYFWIDRAQDVAGAIFMQSLPFADPICLRLLEAFETEVYRSLREGT